MKKEINKIIKTTMVEKYKLQKVNHKKGSKTPSWNIEYIND
jgi:hypothetical protein